ncbi:MAG: DNA replication/repair protein RecF [Selenomonadaceae bacterium]|nr:DNA replication/repair protein RecF [Selenomonadaceae bacterium]
MIVHSLSLKNYRNYAALDLQLSPNINILLGANAQGKTNLIEAIYYASFGHSHRTRTDAELILWEEREGTLRIDFERMGVPNVLEFLFHREKRRNILFNGHPIRPRELIGNLNTVLFSPEDLLLVKGAPAGRRRFLDGEISQASPSYYQELLRYNKILVQRNTLLKRIRERKAKPEMLEPWDIQLAESAEKITSKRLEAIKKLNMLANLMHRRISGNRENLSVSYEIHGQKSGEMTNDLKTWYNKKMEESREQDVFRGSTGIGPHHDDVILEVNGINLRSFGSQGQQRTGILALKLAELEFLRSGTGEYPVLLLDDVMSELDAARRKQLLDFIRRERIQTLVAATEEAYFPQDYIGTCYDVREGTVSKR